MVEKYRKLDSAELNTVFAHSSQYIAMLSNVFKKGFGIKVYFRCKPKKE